MTTLMVEQAFLCIFSPFLCSLEAVKTTENQLFKLLYISCFCGSPLYHIMLLEGRNAKQFKQQLNTATCASLPLITCQPIPDISIHEFYETCHSVTFHFMKKRLQPML